MKRNNLIKMILSALFLSIGFILPLLTGQIKEIGDSLLPMHLPVMLCGLICGGIYGGAIGFMLPFLRSFVFGMPPLYPNALWMSAELMAYGLSIGLIYSLFKKKDIKAVYVSLVSSMLIGRIIWGAVKAILLGVGGKSFTLAMFISGGFIDALLGIVLQLILIPVLMKILPVDKINDKR